MAYIPYSNLNMIFSYQNIISLENIVLLNNQPSTHPSFGHLPLCRSPGPRITEDWGPSWHDLSHTCH